MPVSEGWYVAVIYFILQEHNLQIHGHIPRSAVVVTESLGLLSLIGVGPDVVLTIRGVVLFLYGIDLLEF